MTIDDINKLLEHSFKDESLRNEVWKDFYAILPAPIGIGFDDDALDFLDALDILDNLDVLEKRENNKK